MNQGSSGELQPKKPSGEILRHEIQEAVATLNRPIGRLGLSGFSAGLDLSFSVLLMAVVHTLAEGTLSPPVLELLVAGTYAFGFILVILGRSELFTEQTTLAVLPVLGGVASIGALARLWAVVYLANLLGAAAFSALIAWAGPALGVVEPRVFGKIAHEMVAHPWAVILASALLAGWLMGLLSWLVAAGRDTISQIVIVLLIAGAIGFGKLHHTVVGTTEVLVGVFSGKGAGPADFGHFLLWTTLGNAIGGAIFVALFKYGHSSPTSERG